jgi:hypothetical protein
MTLQSLLGSEAMRRLVVHFVARPESDLHFRALERRLALSRQSLKNALDTLERMDLVVRTETGVQDVWSSRMGRAPGNDSRLCHSRGGRRRPVPGRAGCARRLRFRLGGDGADA